jgi:hypothetical protein
VGPQRQSERFPFEICLLLLLGIERRSAGYYPVVDHYIRGVQIEGLRQLPLFPHNVTSSRICSTAVPPFLNHKRDIFCGLRIATSHFSFSNLTSLRNFSIDMSPLSLSNVKFLPTLSIATSTYTHTHTQTHTHIHTYTHTTQQKHFPFPRKQIDIKLCL